MINSFTPIVTPILIFLLILILNIFCNYYKVFSNTILMLSCLYLILPVFIIYYIKYYTDISHIDKISFLYYLISFAYIQTYPAFQASSPTILIFYFLHQKNGKTKKENLKNYVISNSNINQRLNDLESDGFIKIKNDSKNLTFFGNVLASFFIIYRNFLGLKQGRG